MIPKASSDLQSYIDPLTTLPFEVQLLTGKWLGCYHIRTGSSCSNSLSELSVPYHELSVGNPIRLVATVLSLSTPYAIFSSAHHIRTALSQIPFSVLSNIQANSRSMVMACIEITTRSDPYISVSRYRNVFAFHMALRYNFDMTTLHFMDIQG